MYVFNVVCRKTTQFSSPHLTAHTTKERQRQELDHPHNIHIRNQIKQKTVTCTIVIVGIGSAIDTIAMTNVVHGDNHWKDTKCTLARSRANLLSRSYSGRKFLEERAVTLKSYNTGSRATP